MDRRRFIPSVAGLETRQLLSTVTPSFAPTTSAPTTPSFAPTPTTTTSTPTATAPAPDQTATPAPTATPSKTGTVKTPVAVTTSSTLRTVRIEQLPRLLGRVDRHRRVPPDLIAALQANLAAIENRLRPPSTNVVATFNLQLRDTIPYATLSKESAARLNRAFALVLSSAGASDAAITQFAADMDRLAKLDSHTSNGAHLAANDYALIAQLCMGIGLRGRLAAPPTKTPIATPTTPNGTPSAPSP